MAGDRTVKIFARQRVDAIGHMDAQRLANIDVLPETRKDILDIRP